MTYVPTISVCMTTFNSEKYVAQAISSVLLQTFKDFELIIVDDASTDNTQSIIKSFDDSRIRLIINDDRLFLGKSRNLGFAKCLGEYISIADSDDTFDPDLLATHIKYLRNAPQISLVGCCAKIMDENGRLTGEILKNPYTSKQIPSALLFFNVFVHSSILARKQDLPKGLYQYDTAEDYGLYVGMVKEGRSVANLRAPLVNYRVHKESDSHKQWIMSDKTKTVMKDIMRKQLLDLEIVPNTHELEIHYMLSYPRAIATEENLPAISAWLDKLLEANKRQRIYDEKAFEFVLNRRWLAMCQALGLKLLKHPQYLLKTISSMRTVK